MNNDDDSLEFWETNARRLADLIAGKLKRELSSGRRLAMELGQVDGRKQQAKATYTHALMLGYREDEAQEIAYFNAPFEEPITPRRGLFSRRTQQGGLRMNFLSGNYNYDDDMYVQRAEAYAQGSADVLCKEIITPLAERIAVEVGFAALKGKLKGYRDGKEAQRRATYKNARRLGYPAARAKEIAYFDAPKERR